jgi:hypothetical protein
MKKNRQKNSWLLLLFVGIFTLTASLTSCNSDTENNKPMKIDKVFLQNAQAANPDREVEFGRLGQTLRLQGSGFTGVKSVYINGHRTMVNPVLITDNNIILQISNNTPIMTANDDVRNTIILEKSSTNIYRHHFDIRSAAPSIIAVSHTMPQAGELITLYGTGMQEISSITFPGGITVTAGIQSDDETGTWATVTVPTGITESGSILVIGANGGAYSPAYFNFKEGLLHNFDDVQNFAWGSGINNVALTDVIPVSAGNLPKSQGGYQAFNTSGNLGGGADQRFWLNSGNVMNIMEVLPGITPTEMCAIQMDIYVEGAWNSGIIRMAMADGWGASRFAMVYSPIYVNGAYTPAAFVNPNCWFTITLPFSLSADFEGLTLDDVIGRMDMATFKQAGPWFENSGIPDVFAPVAATQRIYFDNIRIVPLETPAYSDFPEDED